MTDRNGRLDWERSGGDEPTIDIFIPEDSRLPLFVSHFQYLETELNLAPRSPYL